MVSKSPASKIPSYKITVWEIIVVVLGAIAIVSGGFLGLALKFFLNATNQGRAETIAHTIMDYTIPGGARGQVGINFAGAKVAVLATDSRNPDVQLLIARVPVNEETDKSQVEQVIDNTFLSQLEQSFEGVELRTEKRTLCGTAVPVEITEGQLMLPNQSVPRRAIQSKTSLKINDRRYLVRMIVQGQEAQPRELLVFNSLKCKRVR